MKNLFNLKAPATLACVALLACARSASADILFTDNFTFPSAVGSQDVNQDINTGRQGGLLGTNSYILNGLHHQVYNTGTDVGQPVVSDGNYVLVANNGSFQSSINIAGASTTTLTFEFDMYRKSTIGSDWGSFSLRRQGDARVPVGANEFGFLHRGTGGVQVFNNGGITPSGWDTANFASSPHWKIVISDTNGTGSAFVGNVGMVTFYNGTNNTLLGSVLLTNSPLTSSDLFFGWGADGPGLAGIDNLVVSGTRGAVKVTTDTQAGANPFTPSYTLETPNLIAGMSPSTANGDFAKEFSGGTPVLTDGTIGASGTIGGFATCGGGGNPLAGNTLVYTLTNSLNGSDITNIVVYTGWGDGGRFGQYYKVLYATVSAPTTFIPITTVCYISGGSAGNGGQFGAPSSRVSITTTNGAPLAIGAGYIKFDFSSPPNASSFNNGYQGYSEIVVQGADSATLAAPPSPFLTQDTLPNYAETVVGDQVVFTAAYSNAPPANLQWLVVRAGVTNVLANQTNSILTLNNVQTNDSGTYVLRGVNATNGAAAPSFSTGAALAVGNTPAALGNVIVKYASQNFPNSTNFFPAWPVTTNSLIYGFLSGSGPGTFTPGVGDFAAGNSCNADPAILADGAAGPVTSTPSSVVVAGGLINVGVGSSVTYTLITNASPLGFDLTNIVVFGGWQDAGRDEQKYQILYATLSSPTTFVPMVTADYNPTDPGNKTSVSRTTLVPAAGVLAQNVVAIRINWDLSPGPENGWEGYSEFIVQGKNSTGVGPSLVQDITPQGASDVVGGQIIMTAIFTNYTSLQWKKDGTNVSGATSSTLTLNNLSTNDVGAYTLVASNPAGSLSSAACLVRVNPTPTNVANVIVSIAEQTASYAIFTPTWSTNALGASLISGLTPSSVGPGDFTGGTFGTAPPTGGSDPSILTDGTFGTMDFGFTTTHLNLTCMGGGTGTGNTFGGQSVTYTLPVSANGYTITNIVTAAGWNDAGRDQQAYTVFYSTLQNPDVFLPFATVNFNPTNPIGYSLDRATITAVNGVLAQNVNALRFDMNFPGGENGYSGYSEFAVYGTPTLTPPAAVPVIAIQHEEAVANAFVAETPNLIANQLPSSSAPGVFTLEGLNVTNLTDGIIDYTLGASCGANPTNTRLVLFPTSSSRPPTARGI